MLITRSYKAEYKTEWSAGIDLQANWDVLLYPFQTVLVKLGAKVDQGGYIYPRSSLSKNRNIICTCTGVIDEDYRGEMGILLMNCNNTVEEIIHGERIAQFVPFNQVEMMEIIQDEETYDDWDKLYPTKRGTGGFGSTNV